VIRKPSPFSRRADDGAFGIGEAVEMGNNIINFGFVGGDGLPLGGKARLERVLMWV